MGGASNVEMCRHPPGQLALANPWDFWLSCDFIVVVSKPQFAWLPSSNSVLQITENKLNCPRLHICSVQVPRCGGTALGSEQAGSLGGAMAMGSAALQVSCAGCSHDTSPPPAFSCSPRSARGQHARQRRKSFRGSPLLKPQRRRGREHTPAATASLAGTAQVEPLVCLVI